MPPPPKRKSAGGTSAISARKKARPVSVTSGGTGGGTAISIGSSRGPQQRAAPRPSSVTSSRVASQEEINALRSDFIAMFSEPQSIASGGVANSELKERLGDEKYRRLVPVINDLLRQNRLEMTKRIGPSSGLRGKNEEEMVYVLISEDLAAKFDSLDMNHKMVYQVIEKGANMGLWVKDIRTQTGMQQQPLNKILKALEGRKLIKQVKSVAAKQKKIFMLFHLQPAKELTGGPWYQGLDFDHDFILQLQSFIMICVRRLNSGKGVTLPEVADTMRTQNISKVQLGLEDVRQLVQTLAYDYKIEQIEGPEGSLEPRFVAAKKMSCMCEFKCWDVVSEDFHFREIEFDDGIILSPHEPHYHTP
mmetsp:Transcript_34292/g.67419  ORF Transcript_34292/g.67419 Transcript_34292/m.67419 type:complete len:362 (+) Transcript_34292:97-1182(+)|eukprot:CAMPEP_0194311660 /NCGR_PEP_ID=MMETSP0171-20130528/8586_1 /TAXON_ID=218684 /ORGANISM="Corethron pennatum, Strain L29A3" /LENGTH=361 /DNA_ID=CAMNT_0039065813 /DNA_START=90 /DNA_END=1175 /DNA_ORIENTATION=+